METSTQSRSEAILIKDFSAHLKASSRIVALLGAGLSAPSGIPVFRGPGSLWRGITARELADKDCLVKDPVLFWHYYNHRRHVALRAKPNPGHYALAKLAQLKDCLAISQNIDGLSQRAGHDARSLVSIHGSLFETECNNTDCEYAEDVHYNESIVEGLATLDGIDIANATVPLPPVTEEQLPHCPHCGSLMRPSVVLFSEKLYQNSLDMIEEWFEEGPIDLLLVVGTSAVVDPAGTYISRAWEQGAKIAIINTEVPGKDAYDWYFQGDAAEILPLLLKEVLEPESEIDL